MTWEELKEKAREMGYTIEETCFWKQSTGLVFHKDGDVVFLCESLAKFRTPKQMYMIMRGLK